MYKMFFELIFILKCFSHIREDLTNVNMSQLRSSDIDSEHSSPDKINRIVKSPIDKSKKVFTGLNFVLSYAKYKRMPMTNDSDPGNTDNELPTSKLKLII